MALDYLDFDVSEDEDGNTTWDALASVASDRWPALLAEVQQVLDWASRRFRGQRAPLDEGGDWDYDLSAQDDDHGRPLALRWDARAQQVLGDAPQPGGYTTLSLTLTGTAAFGEALRAAFELE